MSFNVRYANNQDGKNVWRYRQENATNMLLESSADIIGMQEVLETQRKDLVERLNEYDHVGVGRDDGKKSGEFSSIFYKKDKFSLLDSGTFWLSNNPNTIGKAGWDAALPRIATWVLLKDTKTGVEFFVLNTHYDHKGIQAPVKSSELILKQMEVLAGNRPIIMMGDLNSYSDSEAIQTLKGGEGVWQLFDSRKIARTVTGEEGTFHSFGKLSGDQRERIDYIFVNDKINVNHYQTLPDGNEQGFYSDHAPILTHITIK
ncbi:endonuclease/exonuclease/phosphatase family protein [Bacteroidales bacterium OttesenSCG-928-M11]|nr:endonuclease/exonuclease/phosphatase family protein [Bacteroidales bacterium OttesenSCG-928-M11]